MLRRARWGATRRGARACYREPYTARLVLNTVAGLELVHHLANVVARSGHHILGAMYLYELNTSTMPCWFRARVRLLTVITMNH